MFLYDPSGNALEFKAFKDPSRLFAKYGLRGAQPRVCAQRQAHQSRGQASRSKFAGAPSFEPFEITAVRVVRRRASSARAIVAEPAAVPPGVVP